MEPVDVRVQVVACGAGSAGGRKLSLSFTWRREDPLTVSLEMTSVPDHPSLPRGSWDMLRDFVRYGLDEPTGDGDVRMVPDEPAGLVRMELSRTAPRPVALDVPIPLVRGFLDTTDAMVPAGAARPGSTIDELIARLLESE